MKQARNFTCWMFANCERTELFGMIVFLSAIPGVLALFILTTKSMSIIDYFSLSMVLLGLCLILRNSLHYQWRWYKREQEKMFEVLTKEEK